MPFYSSEECATFISELLAANKSEFTPPGGDEVKDIYPAEQRLVPKFPAFLIVPGPINRQLVQTGMQAELSLRVFIYIMHAKLTKTRSERTQEDIRMARKVSQFLHANKKLDGNVIHSLVEAEIPGSLAGPQGLAVVGTRLDWVATQREVLW